MLSLKIEGNLSKIISIATGKNIQHYINTASMPGTLNITNCF